MREEGFGEKEKMYKESEVDEEIWDDINRWEEINELSKELKVREVDDMGEGMEMMGMIDNYLVKD